MDSGNIWLLMGENWSGTVLIYEFNGQMCWHLIAKNGLDDDIMERSGEGKRELNRIIKQLDEVGK